MPEIFCKHDVGGEKISIRRLTAGLSSGCCWSWQAADCSGCLDELAALLRLPKAAQRPDGQAADCELLSFRELGVVPPAAAAATEPAAIFCLRNGDRPWSPVLPDRVELWRTLVLLAAHGLLLRGAGLILHAAMMEFCGRAMVITASSGIGKTTCARRIPAPWRAWCDDWTLLCRSGNGWRAHPLPTWSALKEGVVSGWPLETSFPLGAVYQLRRGSADGSRRLRRIELFSALYAGCHWQVLQGARLAGCGAAEMRSLTLRELGLIRSLVKSVPGFELTATLDGHFWEFCRRDFGDWRLK